jgi:DNA-binding transcriptional ArsR family regulator
VLAGAEADRRTVEALRALIAGGGARVGRRGLSIDDDAGDGGGRRANVANDGRILEAVRGSKEGVRVGDLIKQLRLNRKALTRALKRLRDTGQVKMAGEKRLARYHAV